MQRVRAPTLLIVGSRDEQVLQLNESASTALTQCKRQIEIVPDATHLFEEPGALEQVAALAARWFSLHLKPPRADPGDRIPRPAP